MRHSIVSFVILGYIRGSTFEADTANTCNPDYQCQFLFILRRNGDPKTSKCKEIIYASSGAYNSLEILTQKRSSVRELVCFLNISSTCNLVGKRPFLSSYPWVEQQANECLQEKRLEFFKKTGLIQSSASSGDYKIGLSRPRKQKDGWVYHCKGFSKIAMVYPDVQTTNSALPYTCCHGLIAFSRVFVKTSSRIITG